ncbi:MAG: hypothetical protein CMD26_01555 [Flavobacteriales bacterium]|nr:hypothetical protein [Flavobacteriales bacterium]
MNLNYFLTIFFFSFSCVFAQNNDEITNALLINCESPVSSTTIGANSDQTQLTEWGVNDCGTSVDDSAGVWYYIEGDDADYVLRMCGSSFDTKLHVFQDDGFNISCVTGNDDGYVCEEDESSYLHSEVSFYASSNYDYYIYVSGYGSYEGDFVLTLYCNIQGCTDPSAENYCDYCLLDDESCQYTTGCMDIAALNFSEDNDISDPESCEYPSDCNDDQQLIMIDIIIGSWSSEITWEILNTSDSLTTQLVANSPPLNSYYSDYQIYTTYVCLDFENTYTFNSYDSYGDGWNDGGLYELSMCDGGVILANNNETAPGGYGQVEDIFIGSENCDLYGCMDEAACNYDGTAQYESNCLYPPQYYDCIGNCINDLNANGICDELDLYGCTDSEVINFNPEATFDDGSCLYSLECSEDEIQIDVLINTDPYPYETSFTINDNQGVLWATENEVFQDSYTAYPFQYCLPIDGCYVFNLYDSYGDGLFSSGGAQVFYQDNLVLENPNFNYNSSITMNCPPGYDCNTAIEIGVGNYVTETSDYWYVFTPESNGQYDINTCSSNCNTIIYVYDYCTGLLPTEANDATIYYNDDLCGVQSQVFPLMSAGETYYIRIKADCNNIDWELNYVGPVSGCIDPSACNFNPIAEIDDNSCIYPGNPDCVNGPDLLVMPFENSMYLQNYSNEDGCAIEEGCLTGYGDRSIIRFDTWIKNVGNLDYFIGSVSDNEETSQFEWDECHNHWHYKGYAEYVLFDSDGQILPVGFKNGFCVMDLECSGDEELGVPAGNYTYGCSIMGISAGCGDIYGSGLSCQWIDITNVPDGEYTFVVRTNWDQDPDALGNIELSYENNWEQTCIGVFTNDDGTKGYYMAIDIDSDGISNINDPDVDGDGIMNSSDDDIDGDGLLNDVDNLAYGLSDCPVYTDCFGVEFGNAQYDCNGICGGESMPGDLNLDTSLDIYDLEEYSLNIVAEDIDANSCNDLDMDGNITVTDVALLVNCIENSEEITRDNQSEPCEFGLEITNPNDTVTFSIGELNLEDGYVDIHILNPNNEVLGYQFIMGNISISSIENLVSDYQVDINFNPAGMVLGISYQDSLIMKNYEPAPLCRIYYSSIESNTCIESIIDVVNQDYENVIMINDTESCQGINVVNYDGISIAMYPNPASYQVALKLELNNNSDVSISINNVLGQSLMKENDYMKDLYKEIDISTYGSGVYFVNIMINDQLFVKQLVIE